MNTLVYLNNNDAVTDTLKIVDSFNKRHDNILAKVEYLLKNSTNAHLNFKASSYRDSSGKSNKYYIMNRDGFLLLLMNLRGKEVLEKQEAFIELFNQLEQLALEVTSPEYLEYREHLKDVRKSFTDTVKEFIEYATVKGSDHADRYYTIMTKDINMILFGEPKVNRNTIGEKNLQKIEIAETLFAKLLKDEMLKDVPYKKARVNALANLKISLEKVTPCQE